MRSRSRPPRAACCASPTPTGLGTGQGFGAGGEISLGQDPIGEILRVPVSGHLGNGEPVTWNLPTQQAGFDDVLLPSTEIVLPHKAVYGIEGDFSWTDGFVGGGRVSLKLNGAGIPGLAPIRAGTDTDNKVGRTFSIAQEFVANKGDRLSLWVDHGQEGFHHDLHGEIEVATKEPLLRTIPGGEVSESMSPNSQFFSSGGTRTLLAPRPSGIQVGDHLVVFALIILQAVNRTWTDHDGWKVLDAHVNPSDDRFYYRLLSRRMSPADIAAPSGPSVGTHTTSGLLVAAHTLIMSAFVRGASDIVKIATAYDGPRTATWRVPINTAGAGPMGAFTAWASVPGASGTNPGNGCVHVTDLPNFQFNSGAIWAASYRGSHSAVVGNRTAVVSRAHADCDSPDAFQNGSVGAATWRAV
jgi:hypothetical protein